jgi:hypothetical protein
VFPSRAIGVNTRRATVGRTDGCDGAIAIRAVVVWSRRVTARTPMVNPAPNPYARRVNG